MKKIHAILMAAVFVVLAGFTAFLLINGEKGKAGGDITTTEPFYDEDDSDKFKNIVVYEEDIPAPLMDTDIPGVFYAMDKKGGVYFYRYTGGKFEKTDEAGIYEIKATLSAQTLPVSVHYITENGVTNGFGLFLAEKNPDVYIYDYAFFKLKELPPGYKSSGSFLLLIDTDKNNFYKDEKIYGEAFYFNTKTGKTNRLFENLNRAIGPDGAERADFAVLTDRAVDTHGGGQI
ncbi:MAG: hypothetical protein FWF08_05120, partial [Oscillospiraceae bacterium]|nr:hypothetical protein [Oscillospiraceae bacterium]